MTTRPIILANWQVRAALDGRLALLVVPLRPQPKPLRNATPFYRPHPTVAPSEWHCCLGDKIHRIVKTPFAPGDRLVVKETWWTEPNRLFQANKGTVPATFHGETFYKADDPNLPGAEWRSPITMPRYASRLTLAVTDVSVKRAGKIGAEECIATGIDYERHKCGCEVCTHTSTICPATTSSMIMEFAGHWIARYPRLPFETTWAAFGRVTVERRNVDR